VVEHYVKIRKTKNDTWIKRLATLDPERKEELKKEKRKLQEQLRRINRSEGYQRVKMKRGRKKSHLDFIQPRKLNQNQYSGHQEMGVQTQS
jgi:hypothetical protein